LLERPDGGTTPERVKPDAFSFRNETAALSGGRPPELGQSPRQLGRHARVVHQERAVRGHTAVAGQDAHPLQTEVLLAAGAFIATNSLGYIVMAYLVSYCTAVLGLDRSLILTCTLIAAAV